ncbi:DUF3606 domain-containing protein [Xylanibacter oryzae]|uniref:DUF3606 domain-containing protein n=1 Tax=Xylanibacter oryzae TaxID=185293 RepID=UPI0004B51C44|nr:DUF3606 domain-containing protein [Xylanibacter oryzae]
MDNLKIKEPIDGSKINIHEEYEVNYWCQKFKCTKQELKNAVYTVGDSVVKVESYLSHQ